MASTPAVGEGGLAVVFTADHLAHGVRRRRSAEVERAKTTVVIRLAGPADSLAIARLAELEETPSSAGPTLVAVVDDRNEAALPLDGSAAVANPFSASGPLADLLRLRAEQLAA